MSKSTRSKNLKKNCAPTEDLVSNFINNPEESEAAPSKKRRIVEENPDDSLKFFKPPKLRSTKSSEATSSNAATIFINGSSKKPVAVKSKAKAATKTSKRKPKAQPDIRKVLSRQDQLCNQAVTDICLREGLDPDEMQLALAISESLKDQNKTNDDNAASTSTKFDNPFSSMGKVKPITAVLEKFGFKSETNFSEYERDLLANLKITKKSKFQKFPTILTRTSNEERTRMIQDRIDDVLDKGNQSSFCDYRKTESFVFKVSSFYLQEMHENSRTAFVISSEDRPVDDILLSYYVTDLFEPSFVKTGHLLKNWRAIPGRDPTPERQLEERSQDDANGNEVQGDVQEKSGLPTTGETQQELKISAAIAPVRVDLALSESCEDIFADLEECDFDENYTTPQPSDPTEELNSDLNEHLDNLNVKLSQSIVLDSSTNSESLAEVLGSPKKEEKTEESTRNCEASMVVEIEDAEMIDLTLRDSTENEVSIPYDDSYYSLQQHVMKSRKLMSPPVFLSRETEAMPVKSSVVDKETVEVGSDSDALECDQAPSVSPKGDIKARSPVALQECFTQPATPVQINLVSSEEETNFDKMFMNLQSFPTIGADLSPESEVPVNSSAVDGETVEKGSDSTIELEEAELEALECEKAPKGDDKAGSAVASQEYFTQPATPVQIDLVSSEEETNFDEMFMNLQSFHTTGAEDEDDPPLSQNSTQNSTLTDDDEVIEISDEEINYSMRRFHNRSEESYQEEEGGSKEDDAIDLTQTDTGFQQFSQVEVNNLVEQSLIDVMGPQEEVFNINDTVSSLLETSVVASNLNITRSNESVKFMQNEGLSDSLREIMARYGASMESKDSSRSLRKMQSDSNLINESVKQRNTFQFEIEEEDEVVDLTQPLFEDEAKENSFCNMTIHQSLQNILSNTPIRPRTKVQRPPKKSLGVQIDDDYKVDTESTVAEPEFSSMTPVELKQALFKYGIRPLPVKKAVTLLQFIFDQLHPKISVAGDGEVDANDTRRAMNITDIVTNIGMKDDDDFVFQPGLVDDEEIVLPKSRKSKTSSCAIPLHISFYNMVRSNEKIQKFILEFRPIELDLVCKHFRKFGLSYELNDIIAFLDRRCITFKTKEKSYSKTHERKKQKRAQKSQKTI